MKSAIARVWHSVLSFDPPFENSTHVMSALQPTPALFVPPHCSSAFSPSWFTPLHSTPIYPHLLQPIPQLSTSLYSLLHKSTSESSTNHSNPHYFYFSPENSSQELSKFDPTLPENDLQRSLLRSSKVPTQPTPFEPTTVLFT